MECPCLLVLALLALGAPPPFGAQVRALRAGVGRADVTGPITEITFMGYGQMSQKGTGLHTRQYARSFIFEEGSARLVLVIVDSAMIGDAVRIKVLSLLQMRFGDLYNNDNVMISSTHSHSTPGGFLKYFLFDITSLGFSKESFNALAAGIVKSIIRGHENMEEAKLSLSKGELLGVSINRSPPAYLLNPAEERKSSTSTMLDEHPLSRRLSLAKRELKTA